MVQSMAHKRTPEFRGVGKVMYYPELQPGMRWCNRCKKHIEKSDAYRFGPYVMLCTKCAKSNIVY